MVTKARILAFAGSARTASWNKKLIALGAEAARQVGTEVTLLDPRDLPLPLYDGDCEEAQGLPENARKLKELMKAHQGLLLACPEYNSSITPMLKNIIDWASRSVAGEPPLSAFTGKVAALLSASPGMLGGLRGLVHVRSILGNINVLVLPEQLAIPKAHEAFDADGRLKDAKQQETLARIAARLGEVLGRLHG